MCSVPLGSDAARPDRRRLSCSGGRGRYSFAYISPRWERPRHAAHGAETDFVLKMIMRDRAPFVGSLMGEGRLIVHSCRTLINSVSRGQAHLRHGSRNERSPRGRWVVALSLGLRQGEALGLWWEDVDLEAGLLRVRRQLTRSRRTLVIPAPLVSTLLQHRDRQSVERNAAVAWDDPRLVFATPIGTPIDSATTPAPSVRCSHELEFVACGFTTCDTRPRACSSPKGCIPGWSWRSLATRRSP
jgi:hypothetical protein